MRNTRGSAFESSSSTRISVALAKFLFLSFGRFTRKTNGRTFLTLSAFSRYANETNGWDGDSATGQRFFMFRFISAQR